MRRRFGSATGARRAAARGRIRSQRALTLRRAAAAWTPRVSVPATPRGAPSVSGRLTPAPLYPLRLRLRDRPSAPPACRWASLSALSRRPDPDRLPAPGSEHDVQPGRGVHRTLGDGDRQRVREPIRAGPIRVDLGDVLAPRREEGKGDVEGPRFLIGNGAQVPA